MFDPLTITVGTVLKNNRYGFSYKITKITNRQTEYLQADYHCIHTNIHEVNGGFYAEDYSIVKTISKEQAILDKIKYLNLRYTQRKQHAAMEST